MFQLFRNTGNRSMILVFTVSRLAFGGTFTTIVAPIFFNSGALNTSSSITTSMATLEGIVEFFCWTLLNFCFLTEAVSLLSSLNDTQIASNAFRAVHSYLYPKLRGKQGRKEGARNWNSAMIRWMVSGYLPCNRTESNKKVFSHDMYDPNMSICSSAISLWSCDYLTVSNLDNKGLGIRLTVLCIILFLKDQ